MKRLHRHILLELLSNALLTLAVVVCVFFLIALALIMGTSRAEDVPFLVVVEHTAYNAVSTLYLTLPMTVLTACLFTYGRLRADGESTAARVAGIHPWQLCTPAVSLGAAACLLLAWLQDGIMPAASFQARLELRQDLVRNLEGILKRSPGIVEKRWKAKWGRRGEDEDGKLVLFDLELLELDKAGPLKAHTFARTAKPILDPAGSVLTLELADFQRWEAGGREVSMRSLSVNLPLEALSTGQSVNRRDGDRSYEELITRARRKAEYAGLAADGEERARHLADAREASTAFHFRVAFAFSTVLFALLGAGLGLRHGLGNRAVVFIVGFLVVVAVYYPLEMLGSFLAHRGILRPEAALWIGNAVVALLAGRFVLQAIRT